MLVDYPQSALAGEARRLSHRAPLAEAVDLARLSNPRRDDAAALATLAALAREPSDDVIPVVQAVRATMMARQGQKDEAASLMVAALRDWPRQQPPTRPSSLPADIARDVADIRTQVFERENPSAPWRKRFEWRPGFKPPYQVINPHITVALAGAVPKRETVYPTSTPDNTLFMPSEQMSLLVESLNALADDRRRAEGRPVVFPRELMDFITAYLPAEQEMIGALSTFASVPNVLSVTFIDEARTRAEVGIRTWSSGGTLRVEKQEGAWHVTSVAGAYVN